MTAAGGVEGEAALGGGGGGGSGVYGLRVRPGILVC